MGITVNRGVVLAVGLVFLSLCSTGRALQCYVCNDWMSSTCETKQECTSPDNTCMKVTRFSDGRSQYGCRVFDRCTIDLIKQEIKTENLELRCCQSRLCNGSFMASPSAVLILSLAAALLLLSW
ncbi:hypothetical protein GDO78_022897 [Eleutherodactylus coqui]|uniref:UPAR/Ly6 domain-containing protein n=1 Tax=Eleutherodactylus coqui TaxID=57060 RepID=A0A8J6EQ95_ELECQ|nr:hypothetical protein GDO78_022897 [Eleutherodactylus coqui]KAG9473188.1 hypothetical protein GDO78_022897 [Eleutherodactylus coqui]KAG9473189.1 hypothetical protein GDO78_022897 [Eleutherodactylus coqui]KAG9473190.1 hypothetical protein GDO78_022897 [Eleutherodactylus coqui]